MMICLNSTISTSTLVTWKILFSHNLSYSKLKTNSFEIEGVGGEWMISPRRNTKHWQESNYLHNQSLTFSCKCWAFQDDSRFPHLGSCLGGTQQLSLIIINLILHSCLLTESILQDSPSEVEVIFRPMSFWYRAKVASSLAISISWIYQLDIQ